MAGWINMPLGREVGLSLSDIALDGNPAPLPLKGGGAPILCPCLLCPDGWMDEDATSHGGRSRLRAYCDRWVPSSPLPKGGGAPQFSAHICCGQMAGWIKMPLGTEVGLGPATLMGSQLYPAERCTAPSFRPKSIVATVAHLSYC